MPSTWTAYIGSLSLSVAFTMSYAFSMTRSQSSRLIFIGRCSPNAETERCGRPSASELATDVARPHSLQSSRSAISFVASDYLRNVLRQQLLKGLLLLGTPENPLRKHGELSRTIV